MDRIYDALTTIPRFELIEKLVGAQKEGIATFVHFLYFASADIHNLYSTEDSDYALELLKANYLLPDGIAIRLLHFARSNPKLSGWKILFQYPKYSRMAIENKNGTDFIPELIAALSRGTHIVMYGTTPLGIGPAIDYIKTRFGLRVT